MDKPLKDRGMSRPNPIALLGVFVAIIGILGGVALAKGGFFVGKHEGDTLHMMQIVFRMAQGQVPHIDFMTPIGALAFAPIALFVKSGFGIGMSVMWAQVLMALAMVLPVWWVAYSRLTSFTAYFFGASVLVLILALVHGEANSSVSISMHYNRWAWAAAYVAIVAAIIPPVRSKALVDGLVIGSMMTALALIKATYFAAFVIPIVVALISTKQIKTLLVGLVTGLVLAGAVTAVFGVTYWLAYLADLVSVATSEHRSAPGKSFRQVIVAPAYLGASLLAIFAVILLRQSGARAGGLVLLLLVPGFFYVTFQNFGNDPQWLYLLAILLLALRPTETKSNGVGWDMGAALGVAAVAAVCFGAPSFLNLAYSPFRHYGATEEKFMAMLPRSDVHDDLRISKLRGADVQVMVPFDPEYRGFDRFADLVERPEAPTLNGEAFDQCSMEAGIAAYYDAMAMDIEAGGHAGRKVWTADIFNPFWMFGDFEPVRGGTPWYYGGLPGIEDADLIVVPICPITSEVRTHILSLLDTAEGLTLTEIERTPLYVLYEKE